MIMVKPSKTRLKQIYNASTHKRSRLLGASLSPDLRTQYGTRSIRVTKGDSVKVFHGEYKGIEGKVTKVHTENGRIAIEGIQREKIRGDKMPVLIHTSNIIIVNLNLNDKWRKSILKRKQKSE
ncbi:MAG: 50S ribosomal protein L24 [Thaumarchaeota archaeon]|nr:50S ribosomal protein L24 [Nitrososphaerota archaeon]